MTTSDQSFFAMLKGQTQMILKELQTKTEHPGNVSEIKDFPYTNFEALQLALKERQLTARINDLKSSFMHFALVSTAKQKIWYQIGFNVSRFSPLLVMILALIFKFYLLIILALIIPFLTNFLFVPALLTPVGRVVMTAAIGVISYMTYELGMIWVPILLSGVYLKYVGVCICKSVYANAILKASPEVDEVMTVMLWSDLVRLYKPNEKAPIWMPPVILPKAEEEQEASHKSEDVQA